MLTERPCFIRGRSQSASEPGTEREQPSIAGAPELTAPLLSAPLSNRQAKKGREREIAREIRGGERVPFFSGFGPDGIKTRRRACARSLACAVGVAEISRSPACETVGKTLHLAQWTTERGLKVVVINLGEVAGWAYCFQSEGRKSRVLSSWLIQKDCCSQFMVILGLAWYVQVVWVREG